MRTTLINTTFWKEDSADRLHLDSKLLYLYMLTSPEKGLANIYHYKPKVISAYSGLSIEQCEIATEQLVELGYIDVFEGYYVLLKGHEMAKKGRFTDKTIEKEKEQVPKAVLEHFNLLNDVNSSGVAPEHKDKDNNKDIDKDISNVMTELPITYGKTEINEMFDEWEVVVGYKLESNLQRNRNACNNLLKKYKTTGLRQLINAVAATQSDTFAPRVSDFVSLQSKLNDLLLWAKKRGSKNVVARF